MTFSDEEIIRTVADDLPVGIWVARAPGGEFIYANRLFAEIMGMAARTDVAVGEYAAPYGIHGTDGALYPEEQLPFARALRARATVVVDDIVIHRTDGRKVNIRAQARPVFSGEVLSHVVIAFIDISREAEAERARADSEARMHRAERLESIGNLAGGIAHDFNNLLAAIRVTAAMLRLDERDPHRAAALEQIDRVTESAAQLTRALLGFAGRGKNSAAPVELDVVVRGVAELAARTIGRHIELTLELGAGDAAVMGDLAQLEQLVMNLVVNARDAMPESGRLTLRTSALPAQPTASGVLGALVLEVCDTGTGIDPAIRERIFEPYFTTKTAGALRGTGLGLATVYGVVQNHGASIEVRDNAPRGTVMRLSFPLAGLKAPLRAESIAGTPQRGQGTILLVDDDALVRSASRMALSALGYTVLVAADGAEALELFRSRSSEVSAVVLDMVMPRVGGPEAFAALRALRPDLPVLLTTGLALNARTQALLDEGARGFLPKPYSLAALADALGGLVAH